MPTPAASSSSPTSPSARRTCRSTGTSPSSSRTPRSTSRCPTGLPGTVLPWMDRYIEPGARRARAATHAARALLHGRRDREAGRALRRAASPTRTSWRCRRCCTPRSEIFVESAVHFMAEAIALLAAPRPAGVDHEPEVRLHHGDDGQGVHDRAALRRAPRRATATISHGDRVHEHVGAREGARRADGRRGVHAARTRGAIMRWALRAGQEDLLRAGPAPGPNVAAEIGLRARQDRAPVAAAVTRGGDLSRRRRERARLDRARARALGLALRRAHDLHAGARRVLASARLHRRAFTRSAREVVAAADGFGSTSQLWKRVLDASRGSQLRRSPPRATSCATLAEQAALARRRGRAHGRRAGRRRRAGCGCATMSRNDPPHLVAMLDLLRQGKAPDLNRVLPGDVVDEITGARERLDCVRPGARSRAMRGARSSG